MKCIASMYNTFYIGNMFDEKLEAIEKDIEEVQLKMKDFKFDKSLSYVYYLGITGSGKSSTINYILSQDALEYTKTRGKYTIKSPKEGYPVIGHSAESCTVIPQLFADPSIRVFHVDPPGFMDTKGAHQELINSYSNATMFQRGTNVKLVIVVEHATLLSGRGGNLPEVAKRLLSLFPTDFDRLTNSIIIVVTKVSLNDYQYEDVVHMISQINRQNQNMGIQCKAMIEAVIGLGNVFIVPMPNQLSKEHVLKIKNGIDLLKPCMLNANASISLSYEAKSMIEDLASKITHEINQNSRKIRVDLETKYGNSIFSTKEEYEQVIRKLKNALSIMINQSQTGFEESFLKFAELVDLDETITIGIVGNMKKMEFCKKLNSDVRPNFNLIESISNLLRECLGNLQAGLNKLATKEEIQAMNQRHEAQIAQRNQQFKEFTSRVEQESRRRQQEAKKEIQSQRQFFQQTMAASDRQHKESMKILQEEIKKLASRPPQVVHHHSGGRRCSIM